MPTKESELEKIGAEFELTEGHPERLYQGKPTKYKSKNNSKKEKFGYIEYNQETGQQIHKFD